MDTLLVDPLHTLYLGVMQSIGRELLWAMFDRDAWRVQSTSEQVTVQMSVLRLRTELMSFYKEHLRTTDGGDAGQEEAQAEGRRELELHVVCAHAPPLAWRCFGGLAAALLKGCGCSDSPRQGPTTESSSSATPCLAGRLEPQKKKCASVRVRALECLCAACMGRSLGVDAC
eukprot:10370495-Alexandrium_andersonii.AAC.1